MSDNEKSAEEQLHDAVWTWVQRVVVAAVLIGAGLFAGYYKWGDAVELRQTTKQLEDRIVDLKNERETLNTQIARERRDKEVCQKRLREAGGR